jgi:transcriptional regulator
MKTTTKDGIEYVEKAAAAEITKRLADDAIRFYKRLTPAVRSLPHVGKPDKLDPLQNVLYKNQYGTWTSIMVRALTSKMEWITSEELDSLISHNNKSTNAEGNGK